MTRLADLRTETNARRLAVITWSLLLVVLVSPVLTWPVWEPILNPWYAAQFGFAAIGPVVLRRRPDHPIGWWMCLIGLPALVAGLTWLPAVLAIGPERLDLVVVQGTQAAGTPTAETIAALPPGTDRALGLLEAITYALLGSCLVTIAGLFTVFPTGRLPSPRWRVPTRVIIVSAIAASTVASVLVGGWGGDPLADYVVDAAPPWFDAVGGLGQWLGATVATPLLIASWILAVAANVARFRRGDDSYRAAARWPALLVLSLCVVGIAFFATSDAPGAFGLWAVLLTLHLAALPFSVANGIVRHGLFDLDVIVSRGLVFAGLAVLITSVYVVGVVGVGSLVGAQGSLALSIATTALIALLFQPARRRLERIANRLVFGRRATPYEVLTAVARTAAASGGGELDHVARLVVEGTGAAAVTIWQRVGDQLTPAASDPDGADHAEPLPVDEPDDPRADLTVPAVHDGEILGAISLARAPGDPVTDGDRGLVRDAARSLGLVLRNARMTAELRQRVRDLDRSRQRLLAAQDDARRQLERDLTEGPGAGLIELETAVVDARSRAEELGVDRASRVLAGLADDTRAAVETVRDLARGIYPPLLEAEGLASALRVQAEKSPSPVTVTGVPTPRLTREAEAALYFAALEALQNAAKHAPGAPVHVTIEEADGYVTIRVRDEGPGFAGDRANGDGLGLSSMRDRLDSVRGRLRIEAIPGAGTEVVAAVGLDVADRQAVPS